MTRCWVGGAGVTISGVGLGEPFELATDSGKRAIGRPIDKTRFEPLNNCPRTQEGCAPDVAAGKPHPTIAYWWANVTTPRPPLSTRPAGGNGVALPPCVQRTLLANVMINPGITIPYVIYKAAVAGSPLGAPFIATAGAPKIRIPFGSIAIYEAPLFNRTPPKGK
jgi:hypothetical protein